jgi:hypothetical protein
MPHGLVQFTCCEMVESRQLCLCLERIIERSNLQMNLHETIDLAKLSSSALVSLMQHYLVVQARDLSGTEPCMCSPEEIPQGMLIVPADILD